MLPGFIQNTMESSIRTSGRTLKNAKVFTKMDRQYDAYDRDIAVVQVQEQVRST